MKLPKYKLKINPDKGEFVDAIALVECPAIESNFLMFKDDKEKLLFNDEKMELLGFALIPDMPIYRKSKDGFEYYVEFTKEEIRFIAQTFFENGFQNNINIDHTETSAKSFFYQSFIIDSERGISKPKDLEPPKGFSPEGGWVLGSKINDVNVWNDIKLGKQKGFSIEGVFEYFDSHINRVNEKETEDILDMIDIIKMLTVKNSFTTI